MAKTSDAGKMTRVRIPPGRALSMVAAYGSKKIGAQVRAIAFVVVYLLAAQVFLFRLPVENALSIALGVGATTLGLALFLEGLFLGIMPLGEQCGLTLPGRTVAPAIALFALVIGVTATLAEPAIGFLKAQGSTVVPWEAPLLYLLLNRGSPWLVWSVSGGVGLAVLLGVFRFLYGWPFKPALYILIPILVGVGFVFDADPLLRPVAGLAWDTGGVTTGPVTVPLVIALGVGVSRISGGKNGGASGLGVVTLASALPVAAVFLLAALLAPKVTVPSSAEGFFTDQEDQRSRAEFVMGGSEALRSLAEQSAASGAYSAEAFGIAFPSIGSGRTSDAEAGAPGHAEGDPASSSGRASAAVIVAPIAALTDIAKPISAIAAPLMTKKVFRYAQDALLAVLPLALVLVLTLRFLLKERIRGLDEVGLGLAFAVLGMFLFGYGMERGLSALGTQAGASLPRAYEESQRDDRSLILKDVDGRARFSVAGPSGLTEYLWIQSEQGPEAVPFVADRWSAETGEYRHVPVDQAVFSAWGSRAGYIAVLVFVFILGIGATLAEPSLAALGTTVEELTTGTYRKSTLVGTVAVGVGLGMVAGFARILFDLPLGLLLGIPYALALILTIFSSEDFTAIAWDAAGVTTGPVTVPLVIAAGLGVGAKAGASGAFGVVAAASVFPILGVLISGLIARARARRAISDASPLKGVVR